jgi:arginine deiminase
MQVLSHVIKIPILIYNRDNSVIIKNGIILNITYNIFNIREAEVVICMILVLLKRADVINHCLNIRYTQGHRKTQQSPLNHNLRHYN